MTPILKKQLSILAGVATLGGALFWSNGTLWAQEDGVSVVGAVLTRQKFSRDEAATKFAMMMRAASDPQGAYAYVLSHPQSGLYGAVSRASEKSLGSRQNELLLIMGAQWKQPNQIVKVQSQGDKTATVIVEEDPKPPSRPLILIEEDGGWGVDLIETYAQWNHLEGAEKARSIYLITGIKLAGFPHDGEDDRNQCMSNLKQIGLGLLQYVQDWDECYPPAKTWAEAIKPYVRNTAVFNCPSLPKGQRFGYAFNAKLSLKPMAKLNDPSSTTAVYETSALKGNAYGLGENIALRHGKEAIYSFADGHVKSYSLKAKPSFNLKH